MARGSTGVSSSSASAIPLQRCPGFETAISYRAVPTRQTIEYSFQDDGTQGSISNVDPWRRSPRMLSSPARYIQPAEPVYQVQPPRPALSGCTYTSPATTYGSAL